MSDDEIKVIRLIVREALVSSARLGRLMDRFSRGHIALTFGALAEGIRAGTITDRHHPAVLMVATFALGVSAQIVSRTAGKRFPIHGVPEILPLGLLQQPAQFKRDENTATARVNMPPSCTQPRRDEPPRKESSCVGVSHRRGSKKP